MADLGPSFEAGGTVAEVVGKIPTNHGNIKIPELGTNTAEIVYL